MKRILLVLILGLVIVSCGSKKRIVTKKKNSKTKTERVIVKTETNKTTEIEDDKVEEEDIKSTPVSSYTNTTEDYIANFSDIAKVEMRKYKIPASITLAQGILESASGKGRLAVEANNHFGIKCHDWTGDTIHHDDDASQECFRKYKHANESFEDHSKFLTTRSRYSGLFKLDEDDYEAWAKGLRAAGYATDKKYPEKLISLIERFQLYKYDEEVLGTPTKKRAKSSDQITHEVVKGDTLYSLSKRYNLTVQELQKLNGLSDNSISIGQILIVKSN
jgi:flagellum-specific peptidoglycan hydrolase FlgJ